MNLHMRTARPTKLLDQVAIMYQRGLDLEVLADFRDHEGFDGIVLGRPGTDWEIEFIHQKGIHHVGKAPTKEHLLVIYHDHQTEWETACHQMASAGFEQVTAHNPYWQKHGKTFADPEGYRVVIAHGVGG